MSDTPISSFHSAWQVGRTGEQFSLPPVRICVRGAPFHLQDYFTPEAARSLAKALLAVADEADPPAPESWVRIDVPPLCEHCSGRVEPIYVAPMKEWYWCHKTTGAFSCGPEGKVATIAGTTHAPDPTRTGAGV